MLLELNDEITPIPFQEVWTFLMCNQFEICPKQKIHVRNMKVTKYQFEETSHTCERVLARIYLLNHKEWLEMLILVESQASYS